MIKITFNDGTIYCSNSSNKEKSILAALSVLPYSIQDVKQTKLIK